MPHPSHLCAFRWTPRITFCVPPLLTSLCFQTDTKKISAVSIYFETMPYRLNEETGYIDYDTVSGRSFYERAGMQGMGKWKGQHGQNSAETFPCRSLC